MTPEVQRVARRYEWVAKKLEPFIIGCRDLGLQRQAVRVARRLEDWLARRTAELGHSEHEEAANITYTLEAMTEAVRHTIALWIEFKADKAEKAWDELVAAQRTAEAALRFHPCAGNMRGLLAHLTALEQLLFPPMVFLSTGLIVGREECSLCHDDIEKCDHIPGRLYKGRCCVRVVKEIVRLDHASIVERPEDKRCYVRSFEVSSKERNRLTWKLGPKHGWHKLLSTEKMPAPPADAPSL